MTIKIQYNSLYAVKYFTMICTLASLIYFFSCKSSKNQTIETAKQSIFCEDSERQIMKLIKTNIHYPDEALRNGTTGQFNLIVNIKEGGKIGSISVDNIDKNIDVPFVNFKEIRIIGLTAFDTLNQENRSNHVTSDLKVLEREGIRVTKMLESLNLPEWQTTGMEFAISYNFKLTKE